MKTIVLILLAACTLEAQLVNPGFEDGRPGDPPPGWTSTIPGFKAEVSNSDCKSGTQCLKFLSPPQGSGNPGILLQRVSATPYLGKLVRYRAAVRIEGTGPQARAGMWFRVDRKDRAMGFFDNMGERPIRSAGWAYYDIVGEVAPDAEAIFLGLLLYGGTAGMDDATLEILGDPPKPEPARALTARGLENLAAFARLYGYVRFFHPSDQVAATDWERLAREGVPAVEGAASSQELATALGTLFRPMAPTLRVFRTGAVPPPAVRPPPLDSAGLKVTMWRHVGVGLGSSPVYSSRRDSDPAPGGKIPGEYADPREPFRVDLPGGITVLMPLALFAGASGTFPFAPAPPAPERIPASGDDRTTRLASVVIAWNVFQHFYPYFDVVHTDWHAELKTALRSAASDPDAAAFLGTLRRLVAALHDGHGGVYHPSDSAQFSPAVRWAWADGKVVVGVSKVESIAPGDELVAIDGKSVAAVLAEVQTMISGASPQWIRTRALQTITARRQGMHVKLKIAPFRGGEARELDLACDTLPSRIAEPRPGTVKELESGILYVNLDAVTNEEYAKALPDLQKANGIVFDLRGYPKLNNVQTFFGRLSDKPMTSAQWNFPKVSRPDRADLTFERRGEWRLTPEAPRFKAKIAFITDGRAISYAESCMGIVEAYKLGEIVGEPTAGTNGNVNPFTLPGGYRIAWTGMKVLKHDGSRHHGVGIRPTIPVSPTRAGIAAGRDEMLEAAVAAVR